MVVGQPRLARSVNSKGRGKATAVAAAVVFSWLCTSTCSSGSLDAFTGGTLPVQQRPQSSLAMYAEASAGSTSSALVKVTPENTVTAASFVGGLTGLLLGGFWLGAATFVASSYLSRRDDDVAGVLKTLGTKSLEAINYGSSLNDKYTITDTVSSTVSDAVAGAKKDMTGDTKKAVDSVGGLADSVAGAVKSADDEFSIKDKVGEFAVKASSLANEAVTKVIDTATEYKVTDQISKKIEEVTKK